MRVRLPNVEQWTPDFQRQLNGELERALERLNEYALVPYGGTDGQVLTKDTDRPYVNKWSDATGGSGSGSSSIVQAFFGDDSVGDDFKYPPPSYAGDLETDSGLTRDKSVSPASGAYAFDRMRHAAQHSAGKGTQVSTLTDGATVTIDCTLSNVFEWTLGGNRTLAAPTSPFSGQVVNVLLRQDSTGSRLITWNSVFTFPGGAVPSLSTSANAVDLLSMQYDGTASKWRCAFLPGFAASGSAMGILLADGDKGDIVVTSSGLTWTIDAGVVSLAKMANLAVNSLIGNATNAAATPQAITVGNGLSLAGGILSAAIGAALMYASEGGGGDDSMIPGPAGPAGAVGPTGATGSGGSGSGGTTYIIIDDATVPDDPMMIPGPAGAAGAAGSAGASGGTFSGAKSVVTSNKSLTNSLVTWDANEYDTDSYWSAGAPTKLTIPTGGAGKYLVTISVSPTTSSDFSLYLKKNGTIVAQNYGNGTFQQFTLTHVDDAAAGDYFEAYINSAGTIAGGAANTNRGYLSVTRLSLGVSAPHFVQGRLTLTSGLPITTSDVTGATSVYFTPFNGNCITLWNGTVWTNVPFTETTLALGTITSGVPYDVFGYLSSGALALEKLAWTSDLARATAVTLQDGRYCKSGDKTRLYLGTFYTTSTTTTEDSLNNRYLFNQYNRIPRSCASPLESTTSWNYSLATWRQVRATATNQFNYVNGDPGHYLKCDTQGVISVSSTGVTAAVGVGIDSTSVNSARLMGSAFVNNSTLQGSAKYEGYPGIGRHQIVWLEIAQAIGTTTFYGTNGFTYLQTGLYGEVAL